MSEPGRRTAAWRRAGLVALAGVIVLVAARSAQIGVSGLVVELAQHEVTHWTSSPRPRSMQEVSRIADYYTDSLAYAPGNPWALEGLGALDLMRMRLSTVPAEALAYTKDAKQRLREALRQRPTSPFLWANLALAKLYLDEMDDEFFVALRHADELGPWEPKTQQVVLFVSLAAWDKLDPGQRRAVAAMVERGGVHNALKVFEIVKSYRRFDLICGLNSYDAVAGAECRKAAAAAGAEVPKSGGRR